MITTPNGNKLSYVIYGHHSREHIGRRTQELIGFDCPYIIDQESVGVFQMAMRAWNYRPAEATHHLVLQEDVILCRDFLMGVALFIDAFPDNPVSPFSMWKKTADVFMNGGYWHYAPWGCWGLALAMPVSLYTGFLDWRDTNYDMLVKKHNPPTYETLRETWEDRQFMWWFKEKRAKVVIPAPTLVDHLLPSDSLLGYSNRTRVSRCFLGSDQSAIDYFFGKL